MGPASAAPAFLIAMRPRRSLGTASGGLRAAPLLSQAPSGGRQEGAATEAARGFSPRATSPRVKVRADNRLVLLFRPRMDWLIYDSFLGFFQIGLWSSRTIYWASRTPLGIRIFTSSSTPRIWNGIVARGVYGRSSDGTTPASCASRHVFFLLLLCLLWCKRLAFQNILTSFSALVPFDFYVIIFPLELRADASNCNFFLRYMWVSHFCKKTKKICPFHTLYNLFSPVKSMWSHFLLDKYGLLLRTFGETDKSKRIFSSVSFGVWSL